ncbi:MAG TPA: AAA family ATPase [Anaerolineae bacterium]|nr:AAA family ATPase [Anaerolineae bacterium]
MTTTIALAGKGGTGKTTVAALLVDILVKRGAYPVLAIDADPSSNLNLALGVPLTRTVGDLREDLLADVQRTQMGLGVSQREMLDVQIRQAVEEAEDFDLLAMGRPEGPGCYCPVNHSLRQIVDLMSESYAYVVMDNEAGMEHLSRRTTRDVDWMLLVSDPTVRGVTAIGHMLRMADDLGINVRNKGIVINRVPPSGNGRTVVPPAIQAMLDQYAAPLVGVIPADLLVNQYDAEGKPLAQLPPDSPARQAVAALADHIMFGKL